jgi:aspartyl-tRNA(Asn)/glutamyl-tRNA(Gln) amidotransferase subunit A
LGSDTLGSIRLPAAYCGIAGFKPSFGLISLSGVVPLSFRLDHVGPMAARVGDLGLMLEAMAGHEPGDSTSRVDRDASSYDVPALESLQDLRVGVIENFAAVTTDPSVARKFDAVLDTIANAGAAVESLKLDGFEPHATRRAALVIIEAHGAAMMDRYRTSEHGILSEAVQKMFDYGRNVAGVRLARSDLTVFEAATTFRNALAGVDVILSSGRADRARQPRRKSGAFSPHGIER